ncbi:protein translocase subunit SecD [Ornithinimicrobium ciconiae]|uniref:Protein translocase subunit SecD n=1 Tax=Ornithinimicrobium ciconiae TaxID=2594265 RepID=A0A516GAU6_9MICO|nr:protein translocase subunit SecD [Ornithinimicrobium ciconiae]QDO88654.1 protein translocase subunit SecD [Ornithinimicrobium ciconiae]
MAGKSRNRTARNTMLALLAMILVLFGTIGAANTWGDPKGQWTPLLGLDLAGGHQVVLSPVVEGASVQSAQLDQAIDIIRRRVDGQGVAEAEVTRLGGNIQVAIPGTPTDQQLDALSRSSQLQFRAVLVAAPVTQQAPTEPPRELPMPVGPSLDPAADPTDAEPTGESTDAEPTGESTDADPTGDGNTDDAESTNAAYPEGLLAEQPVLQAAHPLPATDTADNAASTVAPSGDDAPADETPADPADEAPATDGVDVTDAPPGPEPTSPSDLAWITPELQQEFMEFDCTDIDAQRAASEAPTSEPIVACSAGGTEKYILGPAEVTGAQLTDASSGLQMGGGGQVTGIVEVRLQFDSAGTEAFREVTTRLYNFGQNSTQNRFAIVLDGEVISAPGVNSPIPDGTATISGGFTNDSAAELANQLKFGALPMSFDIQTSEQLSPTLGGEQLRLGIIAGLVGMILVFIYSLFQYRALGLVTVASLIIAALMAYGAVTLLGWSNNFRLTMAGVTGLIVAIGVTADSFIVYFERIRDEVRTGRPLRYAVDTGWRRARRTIVISDVVNLIAAGVLYFLSESGVKAFAFALGLSTVIDLIVVVMFTHPVVSLLANTKFFGEGHKWSGMDPERLGARRSTYLGRGQFAPPEPKRTGPTREQLEGGIV